VSAGVGDATERDDHDQGAAGAGADRCRAPVEAIVDLLHDRGVLGLDDDRLAGVGADGLVRAVDRPGDRRRRGERRGGHAGSEQSSETV